MSEALKALVEKARQFIEKAVEASSFEYFDDDSSNEGYWSSFAYESV